MQFAFSIAENCPRLCDVKATDYFTSLEYEFAGVVSCLMEMVVKSESIPVRDKVRGLFCEWKHQDLPLNTIPQRNFSKQFRS